MLYADTSALVKLYVRESHSRATAAYLKRSGQPLLLTPFHELELVNAIQLKRFRRELTEDEATLIGQRLDEHEQRGVYHRPFLPWSEMFSRAVVLSRQHTPELGSRSFDILHVACALVLRADAFLTFDDRQSQLAEKVGLPLVRP